MLFGCYLNLRKSRNLEDEPRGGLKDTFWVLLKLQKVAKFRGQAPRRLKGYFLGALEDEPRGGLKDTFWALLKPQKVAKFRGRAPRRLKGYFLGAT